MGEINLDNFLIFLDVDGPLCSYEDFSIRDKKDHKNIFREYSIKALNQIIKYYNADLCMLSSWNSSFPNEQKYKEFMVGRGIKVNGFLKGDKDNRASFVIDQIKAGLKHYLIIDDEAHQYYSIRNRRKIAKKVLLNSNFIDNLHRFAFLFRRVDTF